MIIRRKGERYQFRYRINPTDMINTTQKEEPKRKKKYSKRKNTKK